MADRPKGTQEPPWGQAAENLEAMEKERVERVEAERRAREGQPPPPAPPKPAAVVALEERQRRLRRDAERRYVELLRAETPDPEALGDVADRLAKTAGDVDADLKLLAKADGLGQAAADLAAARQACDVASKARAKAVAALEAATAGVDRAKAEMDGALRRLHKSEQAEKGLAELRAGHPDLFGDGGSENG